MYKLTTLCVRPDVLLYSEQDLKIESLPTNQHFVPVDKICILILSVSGEDMRNFTIRIGTSAKLKKSRTYMDSEQYEGKLCIRHSGALAQGEIWHGLCNNGEMMYGDHVTIAVYPRSPPKSMTICEVHVYGFPVTRTYMTDLQSHCPYSVIDYTLLLPLLFGDRLNRSDDCATV